MTITLAESGLTEAQWNALAAQTEDAIFNLTLYTWQPSFELLSPGSTQAHDFDAILHAGDIYRASGLGVYRLDGTPVGSYAAPSGLKANTPLSLVSDTGLLLFAITSSGISMNSFDGSAWGLWTEIVTDATVVYIGATASDTVHFVTYDSAHKHYHFQVAIFLGSWSVTESDIYWGFSITSFAARRLNGRDILAFSANLPGTPTARVIAAQVVKEILPAGGVCILTYQYGSWSDHIDIDHIDRWSSFRYRTNLCLSVIGDTLWLTAYSSDGTLKYPILGTRLYSSKDGMHWSRGELTAMPGNSSQGVVLLRLDDDVYALPRGSVYRARATLMFGTPADDQQLDVTETLSDLTVNRRDTQQIAFTLDNGSGWIDDSLVSSEVTLAAVLKTGFWYDGAAVLQTIGVFELDSINPSEDQPDVLVKLTGRDRFAWLSSKSESEQFVNWLPQGIGVDEYVDATVTGYGGMGHTAIEDGAWKAYGNKLRLTSNNERGVANSTFLYDCWNGAVQAHFALASEDNSEYAGLVFRAQDKDNQYIYRYDQDDDKLHLYQVAAGIETELWASSAKSWGAIASRFLRADFRYSRIRLYSSDATPAVNALVDWSLEQSLLVDGHSTNAALESGYVGVLGLGFSDLDAWAGSPDPVPVGALPGDYPEFVPPEGPVDPAVEAAFSFVVNGQNVKFTDLSYTIPGDTIVSWNWSFSDSRSTTTQSPRVGFPIGSYTATLTVVTALGSTNSVTQSFSVTSSGWITEVNFADAGAQGWNSMAQYPTTLEAGKGWLVGVDDAGGVYIDLPYAVSFSQVNFHYLWSAPTHPNPAPFYNRAAFASYTDDFANDYTNVYYDLIFWAYGHSTTGGLPGNDPSDPTDGEGGGGWLRSYNYPDKTTPQKTYSFHMTNNYNILYGEEDYRLWIQTLTFQGSGANPFEALDL